MSAFGEPRCWRCGQTVMSGLDHMNCSREAADHAACTATLTRIRARVEELRDHAAYDNDDEMADAFRSVLTILNEEGAKSTPTGEEPTR